MPETIAVVCSSQEGYRIRIKPDEPPQFFSNGIELAEAFARMAIERATLEAKIADIAETLEAYPVSQANWQAGFLGIRRDIEATVLDTIRF